MLEKIKNLRNRKFNVLTVVLSAIVLIVVFKVVMSFEQVMAYLGDAGSKLLKLLKPFILGGIIAYLLSPAIRFFRTKVYSRLKAKDKTKTVLSLISVYLIVALIVFLLINMLIPVIYKSVIDLARKMPVYFEKLLEYRNGQWNDSVIGKLLYEGIAKVEAQFLDIIQNYNMNSLNPTITGLIKGVLDATGTIIDTVFAIVISIYFILEKEYLLGGIKKVSKAFLTDEKSVRLSFYGARANAIFSKYIVGQFTDSIIVGIICTIGLSLIGINNYALYGTIIGVTNMIPYFGPFLGGIPVVILVLFESPLEALWVALFIFALQQIDSMIIAPKVIGESINLSPFWIIFAILVGGGLFGVLGMFLGAPALAFILFILGRWLDKRIESKKQTEE